MDCKRCGYSITTKSKTEGLCKECDVIKKVQKMMSKKRKNPIWNKRKKRNYKKDYSEDNLRFFDDYDEWE